MPGSRDQSRATLQRILEVTRQLGAPLDLPSLLGEVIAAAQDLLSAERGTVFLYDGKSNELYSKVATGETGLRFPADHGIAGECAQQRAVVNVPDAYADERFNPAIDRQTGYRTRCLLTIPLIGHDDSLVGVLQLLNKLPGGVFDEADEELALALGAQCAVAIKRAMLIEEHLLKQKMEQDLAAARDIQQRVLPQQVPALAGYEVAGWSESAEETGGDIYDVIETGDGGLCLLMCDATGHGIGPALSVTQVRSMVRMAVRLGAGLDEVFEQVNSQLADDLPSNRFVTVFLGFLDPHSHELHYHAAGQGPLLHYRAASGECRWLQASTFPMGIMGGAAPSRPDPMRLAPGDIVGLISDGIFEYADDSDEEFGEIRAGEVVARHAGAGMGELIAHLRRAVADFARGAPQADDMTILLVKRLAE